MNQNFFPTLRSVLGKAYPAERAEILVLLYNQSVPMEFQKIISEMYINDTVLSRNMEVLHRFGLVDLTAVPGDRRRLAAELSTKGRLLMQRAQTD